MLAFIIRHLQFVTCFFLLGAGIAGGLTGEAWVCLAIAIPVILMYAWLSGRYSYLIARRFTADASRPFVEAEPAIVDAPYALAHVKPGDELTLLLMGREKKSRGSVISLMHGHYHAAALLNVEEDGQLAAAVRKAPLRAEVLVCEPKDDGCRLRVRIQAASPSDDRLLA